MVSMNSIQEMERKRLFTQQPDLSEQELDQKVARIMEAGQRRTASKPLPCLGVPAEVQAARKLERENVVRRRKNQPLK